MGWEASKKLVVVAAAAVRPWEKVAAERGTALGAEMVMVQEEVVMGQEEVVATGREVAEAGVWVD